MKKQRKLRTNNCYMCGAPATSREHVPPLCLFPEEKDIKTFQLRNNLITVPSCDTHNSKKSKDDEFLMASLAGIVGNNVISFIHFQTKVKRALERKSDEFKNVVIRDSIEHTFKDRKGNSYPVLVGNADLERLRSCFKHVACGLYHHKFGHVFKGNLHILIDFVVYEREESEKYKLLCRKRFEMEPNKPTFEGATPQIFKYLFLEPDEFGLIAMCMTFYENAKVFVAFQGENAREPKNFFTEFIRSGVPLVVSFDDGSQFELNSENRKN